MPVTECVGDIMSTDCRVIVHQGNCTSVGASGLAKSLFTRYPKSDVYRARRMSSHKPDTPGTFKLVVCEGKIIVILFAQRYPGKPKRLDDTAPMRETWFRQCLSQLNDYQELRQGVAFPWRIGCGLAGGEWTHYERMIHEWADKNPDIPVKIYRQPTED